MRRASLGAASTRGRWASASGPVWRRGHRRGLSRRVLGARGDGPRATRASEAHDALAVALALGFVAREAVERDSVQGHLEAAAERLMIPSFPCTPEPAFSFVERELTRSGGQNLRHSALVQIWWVRLSPLSV